ncbi:MAG: type II toxin-antitoxin system RelE/ParE family toxin [Pseudomonadota bacterium]
MAEYPLSNRAASDLAEIADYTIEAFGMNQARHYRDSLKQYFKMLASNPLAGRSAEHIDANLRCFELQSHMVYYFAESDHLLVARILHKSMDVLRHF